MSIRDRARISPFEFALASSSLISSPTWFARDVLRKTFRARFPIPLLERRGGNLGFGMNARCHAGTIKPS